MRHRVVRDAEEAAEFCVFLTRALTKQPYEPQVIPPSPRGHTHTPHRPHNAHTRTGDFRRSGLDHRHHRAANVPPAGSVQGVQHQSVRLQPSRYCCVESSSRCLIAPCALKSTD